MASDMKSVKLRIKSVQNTMQITRAMELVASSKLRKAKERADKSRPYFTALHETLVDIAKGNNDFSSVYARKSAVERTCYVVVGGDRGLAGGYNANLFKAMEADAKGKEICVIPIGKKAVEYFQRRKTESITDVYDKVEHMSVADCYEIARIICKEFMDGKIGHVELCFTRFFSMLSQSPDVIPVLPLTDLYGEEESAQAKAARELILYDPDSHEVFDAIVPEYLGGMIYGSVCESAISELAARRAAMEAATNNAEEMIEKLNLHYNRARQASITQEITEIVGGAEGLA